MTPPTKALAPAASAERAPTRERIKNCARDLYVLRGYDGFSFGDIAAATGTTRANIHHHFGSKARLLEELIEDFVADAQVRIRQHWTEGRSGFAARLARQLEDLRAFYDTYNPRRGDRNVWSPLSRLRLDLQLLGPPVLAALERIDKAYEEALTAALDEAIRTGELGRSAPVHDIALMLRVMMLSCAPMTQDTGSFREIERLFATMGRTIATAWGRRARG